MLRQRGNWGRPGLLSILNCVLGGVGSGSATWPRPPPHSLGLLRPSIVCGVGVGVGVLSKGERELLKSLKCDSCHVHEGSPKTYKRLIYAMSVQPMCVSVCEINELTEWLASQSLINSEHRCNLHKSFSLLPSSTSASDATFMKSSERLRVDQGQ